MAIPFFKLSQESLASLAAINFGSAEVKKQTKNALISELYEAAENAGIKKFVFLLKNTELDDVCNRYLKVEHSPGANQKSKMVLTKRLKESLEDTGLEERFQACNDKRVME